MMRECFRIVQKTVADQAFSGEGARLWGGRWNSKGQRMVYTSSSLALASLEVLVHLESEAAFRRLYGFAKARFPEELCETLAPAVLPEDWHVAPPPSWTSAYGDEWLRSARSVVLKVPSALIPEESNYLLNPEHRDFHRIVIEPVRTFAFPRRLLKYLPA